jgi:short-subunit dehydrogenase
VSFAERYGPWAIVAGASEGTGRAFAVQCAQRGLNCLLLAHGGPLDEVAEEIRQGYGVQCETARLDLAAEDAFDRIVEAAGEREVGLYVANAGSDRIGTRFLDHDISAWLGLLRLNVVTTMRACHHFGRLMRQRGRGGLLIVNSGACYGGGSILATYAGCKGFLLNFAEGLWAELGPHGVDVLTMVLGKTDTPMFRRLLERNGMPIPPDLASPDEVARVALERLPYGPIQNWGLEDDEVGYAWASAADRRARVLQIDAANRGIYGKLSQSRSSP